MPSGEGLPAQRGVRVHHLEVEERTVIGERRRNVAEQFEGDGTVQLGVGDHARSEGAVGKVADPAVLVAPRGELPAQGCWYGRFIFLITQYFQLVHGYSPLSAGLRTLSFALA